jgi:hypothetical protein
MTVLAGASSKLSDRSEVSSETLITLYQTTQHHIPDDSKVYSCWERTHRPDVLFVDSIFLIAFYVYLLETQMLPRQNKSAVELLYSEEVCFVIVKDKHV